MNAWLRHNKTAARALATTILLSASLVVYLPQTSQWLGSQPTSVHDAGRSHATLVLTKVWEYAGDGCWQDVAAGRVNGKDEIFACARGGKVVALSATGKPLRRLSLSPEVSRIEVGALGGKTSLVGWGQWQHTVYAWDAAGKPQWEYAPADFAVDDVHTADIDGDGKREVIIGCNGSGGLHVLNADGTPRWIDNKYGNCWSVGFARTAAGSGEVLTTEARGKIHRFDAAGNELPEFPAIAYFNNLYTAGLQQPEKDEVIALGRTREKEQQIFVFSASGVLHWSAPLGDGSTTPLSRRFAVVRATPEQAIVLAADPNGDIHPFSSDGTPGPVQRLGEPVVSLCASSARRGSQILIVCAGSRVAAYRVGG